MKCVLSPNDNNGNPLYAHGGQIICGPDGYWYWIGEDRTGRSKVSCYRSKDFLHWEFRNHLLTLDSPVQKHPFQVTDLKLDLKGHSASVGTGCNIERPKVLYNSRTKQYVMWMHWELPDSYREARCAVAVCGTIDGDYTHLGSFNPVGFMSRDCTVFQDSDGTAYFISTARENLDLHFYRLSDDYLSIDCLSRVLWPGQQREAPTLFKRHGYYIMLTSGCTGWKPNQGSYAYTRNLTGKWSQRSDFGDETTYRSQPTWVLPLYNTKTGENDYWYLGDRWGGDGMDYFQSKYVFMPISFESDTELSLNFQEQYPFDECYL